MYEVAIRLVMQDFYRKVIVPVLIKHTLVLLIILALLLRVADISFPIFSDDEVRIAYRGFTLATEGTDEFGRAYPLIFNGSNDYQLPAASYLSALGISVFGKNDFGARIPFIALGVALVFVVYKIGRLLLGSKKGAVYSALLIAFSPPLIFLSKTPNETIVLVFLFALLFFLMSKEKVNWVLVNVLSVALLLTSKYAWFLLPPFVFLTLFYYRKGLPSKDNIKILTFTILASLAAFIIFLQIPQSGRSLMENNFTLLTDITVQNGVNRLRGQGIESDWPEVFGKIFFNKLTVFPVGVLHWLSNISPNVYFGQLETSGKFSFLGIGAWAKFLIFPSIYGLFILIRERQGKLRLMLLYPVVLTLPSLFIYPNFSPALVVLTLPFMAFVIALGLLKMKKSWVFIVMFFMAAEVLVNLFYKAPDIKNTNILRPFWVKQVVIDAQAQSQKTGVILSDDLIPDISPYIGWYTAFNPKDGFLKMDFPYRVRQSSLGKIILQGYSEEINLCSTKEERVFFLSPKTLKMMVGRIDIKSLKPDYVDGLQKPAAFRVPYEVCLK